MKIHQFDENGFLSKALNWWLWATFGEIRVLAYDGSGLRGRGEDVQEHRLSKIVRTPADRTYREGAAEDRLNNPNDSNGPDRAIPLKHRL